jgi:PPOX class probable FMN-dependent enzyme
MLNNQTSNSFAVTSMEQLRGIYKTPSGRTIKKESDYITPPGRKMIEASSLIMLATSGSNGADCSPKGDGPGFVHVLDKHTIAIPDRPGNNRLDGMENIIENPQVGVLFLVPGANITYRINGSAEISVDPELLKSFEFKGNIPHTVLLVHVDQAYSHCPKAFIRSNIWEEGAEGAPETAPTHGDFAKFVEGSEEDSFVEKFNEDYTGRLKNELYGNHQ